MAKKNARTFFSSGIFEKPFMRSRITSEKMTVSERLLGYLVGPFGTLALLAVTNQLAELYYTEIFYIDRIFGVGTYLVMSWGIRIVSMLMGLFAAYLVEHSASSQGKIRPLVLIGSLICAVSGFFMFFIPDMADGLRLAWVCVFNVLYNSVGATLFALRGNLLTLCTRDQKERNRVNLLDKMSSYLIVGTAITLTIGSVLYYTFLHGYPAENWLLLVGIFAVLSVPLSFIQYYYTKERITLEASEVDGYINREQQSVPVMTQIKALFRSRYWVLAFVLGVIGGIVANLSGYNLATNFCTVILGATAENNYNLVYTIASGVPLGIGILIVYPLSQKFTIRKTTMAFAVAAVIGCIIGLIGKTSFPMAVAANFVYNIGILPVTYVLPALTAAANDEVEYKFGFRPEGTVALALTGCLMTIVTGAFAGSYETGLSANGYLPENGTNQLPGVYGWIYFVRYVVPLVQYVLFFIILKYMDLEKKLPKMQAEIRARKQSKTTTV